jgi:hypothetical protein
MVSRGVHNTLTIYTTISILYSVLDFTQHDDPEDHVREICISAGAKQYLFTRICYMSINQGFLGHVAGDMFRECGFIAQMAVLRVPISGAKLLISCSRCG